MIPQLIGSLLLDQLAQFRCMKACPEKSVLTKRTDTPPRPVDRAPTTQSDREGTRDGERKRQVAEAQDALERADTTLASHAARRKASYVQLAPQGTAPESSSWVSGSDREAVLK